MVVGIDEVGRGALAGPLCIAAVGLDDAEFEGLTDSKKISKTKRPIFAEQIKRRAPKVGIGWVSAKHIDQIGMGPALKLAAQRAFAQIDDESVTQIIIDGTIRLIDDPRVTTMKQADLLVPCVSAASIIAKVARDEYMVQVSRLFSGYGFEGHVGYGTSAHLAAITQLGPTHIHRLSFAPMSQKTKTQPALRPPTDGQLAEQQAVAYLLTNGYKILNTNWKTKWCEIDIVASKNDVTYFVEVKYRRSSRFGTGLEAITAKKLRQMKFAAELWCTVHRAQDVQLQVVSVTGDRFEIDETIELID